MDTSVFGVSNTVPDYPKWLIWTVWSWYMYGECVRSKIQSARAKKSRIKLPGSRWTLCVKWV